MNPEDRYTTSELLASIHDLADELGRTPTAKEYTDRGRYSMHPIRRRFGRWNAAIDAAGLERNAEYDIPENRLLSDLLRVADELGHPPSKRDYREHGCYAPTTHKDHFGSWKNAIHEAGLEVKGSGGSKTEFEVAILAGEIAPEAAFHELPVEEVVAR